MANKNQPCNPWSERHSKMLQLEAKQAPMWNNLSLPGNRIVRYLSLLGVFGLESSLKALQNELLCKNAYLAYKGRLDYRLAVDMDLKMNQKLARKS